MPKSIELKYGENPHQKATIAIDNKSRDALALANFSPVSGEPMSQYVSEMGWVNLTDLDRGLDALVRIASAFEANLKRVPHIALLVEHGNVCGAGAGRDDNVLVAAINSNYRAAFGSFLVTNVPITNFTALAMREAMVARRPFAGIAAPAIDATGAGFFARRKGKCHILQNPALKGVGTAALPIAPSTRTIRGATMTQAPNAFVPRFPKTWPEELIADMCLAWGVCAASDSNAITIAKDGLVIANAVGQQERAAACELAVTQVRRARRLAALKGAAVVSDSYFAFADGFDILARRRVGAVFATSGSMHDKDVAEHAKEFDVIFHTVPDVKGRIFAGH